VISAESARVTMPQASGFVRLLDDMSTVVMAVPIEVYCAPFDGGISGTIGEHVRHSLDHISALISIGRSDTLSYDHRQRGTAVEADPSAALQQILRLKAGVERWSTRSLDELIRVTSMVSADGETVSGWSTLARELAFVVSHTIHHQAIIGILLTFHGSSAPERFGHSPSTPRRN
jgi:hypothetical protein